MVSGTGTSRRTDEIRKRRTDGSRRSVPGAMRRAQTSVPSTPPVMVRQPMAARPGQGKRKTTPPRRRYDLALNVATGAEMRLPSLPQFQVGWRLISGILTLSLAALSYFAWIAPEFRVAQAQIEGAQRLTARDVNAVLDVADQPIFVLNPAVLERELLEAFPEFSSAVVKIDFPAKVVVSVEERSPVLIWRQEGRTELVDREGRVFPARQLEQNLNLPMVEAAAPAPLLEVPKTEEEIAREKEENPEGTKEPEQKRLLSPEMVAAVVAMAEKAPQNSPLIYDSLHGLGWKDGRGWEAYFGNASDMEMKLTVYKALVKRLNAEDLKPSLVSVEFVHAPYYRLERVRDEGN